MSSTRQTIWSIKLPNEPQLRILLRHIAQKYNCHISPREYAGAANVVQGTHKNVAEVQDQFHAIRMAMYLERAMAVARNSSKNAQTVEKMFTVAFVNRACELLIPGLDRGFVPSNHVEQNAISFANELLGHGKDGTV